MERRYSKMTPAVQTRFMAVSIRRSAAIGHHESTVSGLSGSRNNTAMSPRETANSNPTGSEDLPESGSALQARGMLVTKIDDFGTKSVSSSYFEVADVAKSSCDVVDAVVR